MFGTDIRKKSSLPPEELLRKGTLIAEKAGEKGIRLRLLGGIGVASAMQSESIPVDCFFQLRAAGKESVFADVDFVSASRDLKHMNEFFEGEMGFVKDRIVNALFGDVRRIYYSPDQSFHVDIFVDRLEFNHTLEMKERLDLSFPHISAPDLLLSKLQVHFTNFKDLADIVAISCLPSICNTDSTTRIASVLSDDWGFCYDALSNIEGALNVLGGGQKLPGHPDEIRKRLDILRSEIENHPKSRSWRRREKKGTAKQWWQDVEEVVR